MASRVSKRRKLAFITGGTGSLGKELVREFSSQGYQVIFQYNSRKEAARGLASKFHARAIQIDFSTDFELPDISFDVVVNNAGINITSALTHELSNQDWDRTIKTNLYAPFFVARKYLAGMMKRKWGRIINISSIYGLRGVENNLAYNASKHGLSGLTKSIAKEYAPYGITSNEICPSAVKSQMMNRIALEEATETGGTAADYLRSVCDSIPAKRMASPRDVAQIALFLASEEASFVNGVSIPCDGGMIA